MGIIYLIRHGECVDNAKHILNGHHDTALTALGKKQIKIAAVRLTKAKIKTIYSSPLLRAKQSALIIAKVLGIKPRDIVYDLALIERDYGVLTGRPRRDIPRFAKKILQGDQIEYFLDGRGTEPFPAVYRRAKKVLAKLRASLGQDNVVLVTHGDFGMMARVAFNGRTWRQGLDALYWDNAEIIVLKTGGKPSYTPSFVKTSEGKKATEG